MHRTPRVLLLLSLLALLAAACTSDTTAAGSTTTVPEATATSGGSTEALESEPEEAESTDTAPAASAADFDLAPLVANLDDALGQIEGAWPGFDLDDHPIVLARRNENNEVTGAVTINHPDPDAIGPAQHIDVSGTRIGSLAVVDDIDADDLPTVQRVDPFDFEIVIGGVDSFAMILGGPDSFFDPSGGEYVATLFHEVFHRHQAQVFVEDFVGQDVEGYAYTPENLELALLEERALKAALDAGANTPEGATYAAQAAALRHARLAADDRVALDDAQERIEGTARWIEHQLDLPGAYMTPDNEAEQLITDYAESFGIKDHFGFGRFYSTGAAFITVLDERGTTGHLERIGDGESPAGVLFDEFGLTADDIERLVAEARAAHDPDGTLAGQAIAAAQQATEEPPVFGDRDDADVIGEAGEAAIEDDSEGVELTVEEISCLEENGVDLTSPGVIDDDAVELCLT